MLVQQLSQIHLLHQATGHCCQLLSLPACDRMADQQALREFVSEYVAELKDLTFNSKALINTLTMLASDNLEAASSIAAAIEKHTLTVRSSSRMFLLADHTDTSMQSVHFSASSVWDGQPKCDAKALGILHAVRSSSQAVCFVPGR